MTVSMWTVWGVYSVWACALCGGVYSLSHSLQSLKMYLRKLNLDPVKCKIPKGRTNVAFMTFRNEEAREVSGAQVSCEHRDWLMAVE